MVISFCGTILYRLTATLTFLEQWHYQSMHLELHLVTYLWTTWMLHHLPRGQSIDGTIITLVSHSPSINRILRVACSIYFDIVNSIVRFYKLKISNLKGTETPNICRCSKSPWLPIFYSTANFRPRLEWSDDGAGSLSIRESSSSLAIEKTTESTTFHPFFSFSNCHSLC